MNNTFSLEDIKEKMSVCITRHGDEMSISIVFDFETILWEHWLVKRSADYTLERLTPPAFEGDRMTRFFHSPKEK